MAYLASFRQLWKRYSIVVLFPSFALGSIYADWSNTQKWKQNNKKQ